MTIFEKDGIKIYFKKSQNAAILEKETKILLKIKDRKMKGIRLHRKTLIAD